MNTHLHFVCSSTSIPFSSVAEKQKIRRYALWDAWSLSDKGNDQIDVWVPDSVSNGEPVLLWIFLLWDLLFYFSSWVLPMYQSSDIGRVNNTSEMNQAILSWEHKTAKHSHTQNTPSILYASLYASFTWYLKAQPHAVSFCLIIKYILYLFIILTPFLFFFARTFPSSEDCWIWVKWVELYLWFSFLASSIYTDIFLSFIHYFLSLCRFLAQQDIFYFPGEISCLVDPGLPPSLAVLHSLLLQLHNNRAAWFKPTFVNIKEQLQKQSVSM